MIFDEDKVEISYSKPHWVALDIEGEMEKLLVGEEIKVDNLVNLLKDKDSSVNIENLHVLQQGNYLHLNSLMEMKPLEEIIRS